MEIDAKGPLGDLIEYAPKLASVDAQLMLLERYETTYQIFDHQDVGGNHPFALILMHWNQDVITEGSLHGRMRRFVDTDIAKYFNISFTEFIDQPSYVCDLMIKVAAEKIRKEAPAVAKALKELGQGKE